MVHLYFLYRFIVLFDLIPRLLIHFIKSFFNRNQWDYVKAYIEVIKINGSDIFVKQTVSVDIL